MAKKHRRTSEKSLMVSLCYVATPDSSARLSRAINILLKAAAEANSELKDTSKAEEETPHGQAPAGDALTRGSSVNNSYGEG